MSLKKSFKEKQEVYFCFLNHKLELKRINQCLNDRKTGGTDKVQYNSQVYCEFEEVEQDESRKALFEISDNQAIAFSNPNFYNEKKNEKGTDSIRDTCKFYFEEEKGSRKRDYLDPVADKILNLGIFHFLQKKQVH